MLKRFTDVKVFRRVHKSSVRLIYFLAKPERKNIQFSPVAVVLDIGVPEHE